MAVNKGARWRIVAMRPREGGGWERIIETVDSSVLAKILGGKFTPVADVRDRSVEVAVLDLTRQNLAGELWK